MTNTVSRRIALLFVALVLAGGICAAQTAPNEATITYRRIFKGSVPEFIEIKITDQGKATCDIRQLADPPDAQPMDVGPAVRAKIFELAAKLKNFAIPRLDVSRHVANLGQKTFRYERGSEVHEVSFNYTLNPKANDLMQIFEGLARQQGDMLALQRSMKYDPLGINDTLGQFESDLDHSLLPEPDRLLPILDKIAADSRLVEIARTRARALAEQIRTAQAP